jgi:hypothetical protein
MGNPGPFGFDPDEIREALERFGRSGVGALFDELGRRGRTRPETAGEAGEGVWAIYVSDPERKAHVEQVFKTELDALRANKHNTDPNRSVRFLPYGIDVSVLDGPERPE